MSSARLQIANPTALVLYALISVVLFGLPVIGRPATAQVGFLRDPSVMMWSMVWWPHAIAHRVNPFITHAIWAPPGYNLTWATSIPAPALLFAPVTVTFGPVISYNLAALLAPAASGWAAFLLCRHLTRNLGGAFIGGLIYGFSPYEVGHVLGGHLSLTFILIPPFCILTVLLLIEDAITRRSFVIGFALLLVISMPDLDRDSGHDDPVWSPGVPVGDCPDAASKAPPGGRCCSDRVGLPRRR